MGRHCLACPRGMLARRGSRSQAFPCESPTGFGFDLDGCRSLVSGNPTQVIKRTLRDILEYIIQKGLCRGDRIRFHPKSEIYATIAAAKHTDTSPIEELNVVERTVIALPVMETLRANCLLSG